MSGKIYLSPAISDKVLEGYLKGRQKYKPDTSLEKQSQRENEVMKSVGEGYSSPKSGDILCTSVNTVDKHRSNIVNKLNLHNASALTADAFEEGLVLK